jgi:hypothetical protein
MNTDKLGIGNYIKMMKDSNILDNNNNNRGSQHLIEKSSEIELIYKKSTLPTGNRMNFSDFL